MAILVASTFLSAPPPPSPPPPLPQHFQTMEETHLRHMKTLLGSYAHSVEDTHVQIGQVSGATGGEGGWRCRTGGPGPCPVTHPTRSAQVHEEFKQNIENISVEMLLRKFAESKGTGREKPGESGHLGVRLHGKNRAQEAGDFLGSQFPHQKNGLMTDLTLQPTEEEDWMPDLMCQSNTARYRRGHECQLCCSNLTPRAEGAFTSC